MSLYNIDDTTFEPFCGDAGHYAGWKARTDERFIAAGGGFADFVRQYVPSSTAYQPSAVAGTPPAFRRMRGVLDARDKCRLLAEGLDQLTEDFPPSKILRFVDVHTAQIRFPPEEHIDEHPEGMSLVKPDIVASLPGAQEIEVDPWSDISLVVDVRADLSPDPLMSTHPEAVRTRIRLMRFAGRHLAGQNALCSFVLSVCGPMIQVYRFDHTACIVSPMINYTMEPVLLRMFFWSLVHPWNGTQFVGQDEYCTKATEVDLQWAQKVTRSEWDGEKDLDCNLWIKVPSTDPEEPELEFLTLRRRAGVDMVWSGATSVWEALRRGDDSGTRYIIKDTWPSISSWDERLFYERIVQYDQNARTPLYGIAGFVRSVDYGALAAREETTLHRTTTASLRRTRHARRGERTHVRLVVDTVGTDLEEFDCSRDFVRAIRDAMTGHLLAYKAGVLHCDISNGNVMRARGKPFTGFIHDFDISAWIDSSAIGGTALASDMRKLSEKQRRICRGTLKFLAIELIESRHQPVARQANHDLQSFYWIILLYVLMFTPVNIDNVEEVLYALYSVPNWDTLAKHRRAWLLMRDSVPLTHNKPLAYLMDTLKALVGRSIRSYSNPHPVELDHGTFLTAMQTALTMAGWPENDWAPMEEGRRRNEKADVIVAAEGPSSHSVSWTANREADHVGTEHPRETSHSPSSPRKRAREADADDDSSSQKKQKGAAVSRETGAATSQRGPSRVRTGSAFKGAGSSRPAGEKVSGLSPRSLVAKVMRGRACGFWRYLLRR